MQGRHHGGCISCIQQDTVCHGCQYRYGDWSLPSMHKTQAHSTIDPNQVFRDRKRKPLARKVPTSLIFKTSRVVEFYCPGCGYEYTATMHAGMTLHTNNLGCPFCNKTEMEYHINS
jgi:hypothetical protein